ncbi:MAG: phenylalanine--tRNA ligase subunit beta [Sphingomonadaceae bacterium]
MKFSLSWLRRYLSTDADADATRIAEAMTNLGLEVESVENPAEELAPFIIARVLTAKPHPQADKLQVLEVDSGEGQPLQVVCGAPNARAGLVGVFGPAGAYVPGSDMTLKVAAIRGVESNGMMCSARELLLGEDHDGIIELPEDAPVGQGYASWAGLDDPVFDVSITPNRQDCMGVYGIARDLAAAEIGTLEPLPETKFSKEFQPDFRIEIEDDEGCPAFFARKMRGVRNGPSPDWLQKLLTAAGLRPVSALVDITNYFSIGLGRPLHVYDIEKLSGGLTARRARAGETVLALNGKTYALDESMTVIADDVAVHDIAGIMGGSDSGVSGETTEILIEAAYFDPARIGATGRALGLTSDARQRFERGVDPSFVRPGLDLAAAMIQQLCGGEISEPIEVGALPVWERRISFPPDRTKALAGIDVSVDTQHKLLERLGFMLEPDGRVAVPGWRRDVDGPADLVEEIVRLIGLDKVESVALPRAEGVARPTATASQLQERRLRRLMAARGLDEAIAWSFISSEQAAWFGGHAWTLENPLSAELAVMRPSLLPGMVAAAARNVARGATTVPLFQTGKRYLADGEHPTLAILLAGEARPRDWRFGKAGTFDVFDVKADILAALAAAGAPVERLQTIQPAAGHYHPGRSARLTLGKTVLAEFGELHPEVLRSLDLDLPTVAGEIFLDAIPVRRTKRARPAFTPPVLQAVTRDFAFLVPDNVSAEQLLRAIQGADKALITGARLFDRFTGPGVPEGQASLAVTVTLQPRDKTFTETDLEALAGKVVAAAGKLGAVLRG